MLLSHQPNEAGISGVQDRGVRERAFGSLNDEHLYRHADQIAALADRHREAEHDRQVFNEIRPHETLGMLRPTVII